MTKLSVKREKGTTQAPVYMRDYTEPVEYNYVLKYRGFTAYLIRDNTNSWWIVSHGKWVLMDEPSKKQAETNFVEFVDKHYDKLVEKGFIEKRGGDNE